MDTICLPRLRRAACAGVGPPPHKGDAQNLAAVRTQRTARVQYGHRKEKDSLEPFSNSPGAISCSFQQVPAVGPVSLH